MKTEARTAIAAVRSRAMPLTGGAGDLDGVMEMARGREFVLLGEASHGTHDFYRLRAAITRRLMMETDFDAVIVESDWPDMLRVNRYVQGAPEDGSARDALADFARFPRWMWRNRDVEAFVAWLRTFNETQERKRGVYGLDLYSLHRSAAAVIDYLDRTDPHSAKRARERYGCLDHGGDAQQYGYSVAMGVSRSCEDEAIAQLAELLEERARAEEGVTDDAHFHAAMNARVVRNAERYYRGMFSSRVNTWNLRDSHMCDTLFELHGHLSATLGRPARIVVWAHNSHLGDARATQVSDYGELNLGQLVRERALDRCLLVGFTTYTGHVTAARDWDEPAEHRWVRPALPDSVEELFARTRLDRFFLPLRGNEDALPARALERAIGVIYRPETERQSHYFNVSLAQQFDAVFHLDETTALEPLDATDAWRQREQRGDLPETWPSGI